MLERPTKPAINTMAPRPQAAKNADVLYLRDQFADANEFLNALKNGHRGAQAEFYKRYCDHVERIVLRVLGFDSEVADIVQETFFHAIKGLPQFRGGPEVLKGWLTRIAVIRVRLRLRYRKARWWLKLQKDNDLPEPVAPSAAPDVQHALIRAYQLLERLSADDRIVFTLRIIDNMEYGEIAEISGVSIATVKRRFKRARERFEMRARRDPVLCGWLSGGAYEH